MQNRSDVPAHARDRKRSGMGARLLQDAIGHAHGDEGSAPFRLQVWYILAITLPLVGLVAAIALLWPVGFSWVHLGLLLGMYVLTGLGITVGYHRLFTHRSFETNRFVTFIVGVLGSMAVQGPILTWVATHRSHHQHSDEQDDPHSPNVHGEGLRNVIRGWWHSHVGWMLSPDYPNLERYVPDLKRDRLVRWLSRTFPLWVALGLVIPAALGGLLTLSWSGALLGFLWGGLARVFLIHHVTWSINSVCHLWGARPFESRDQSRNNALFGILAFGEGWHNNHHAFPTSARHGLRWWEIDTSYLVIRGLELIGMAKRVRVPSKERMEAARSVRPRG